MSANRIPAQLPKLNSSIFGRAVKATTSFALVGEDGTYKVSVPGVPADGSIEALAVHVSTRTCQVSRAGQVAEHLPRNANRGKDVHGRFIAPAVATLPIITDETPAPAANGTGKVLTK